MIYWSMTRLSTGCDKRWMSAQMWCSGNTSPEGSWESRGGRENGGKKKEIMKSWFYFPLSVREEYKCIACLHDWSVVCFGSFSLKFLLSLTFKSLCNKSPLWKLMQPNLFCIKGRPDHKPNCDCSLLSTLLSVHLRDDDHLQLKSCWIISLQCIRCSYFGPLNSAV